MSVIEIFPLPLAAVEVPAGETSPQQSSDSQAAPPTDSSSPAHEEL